MEFDKKLFELACRDYVLEVVNESKYLRKRLSLIEHAKIYDWSKNKASYNQVVSLIISEGSNKTVTKEAITEFESLVAILLEAGPKYRSPVEGAKKAGVAIGKFMTKERHPLKFMGKAALVTAAIVGALYLFKKLSDPCVRQCRGNAECIRNCKAVAIKKTIANLQSNMTNCRNTPNPEKCENRIKGEIAKWNEKLTKLA